MFGVCKFSYTLTNNISNCIREGKTFYLANFNFQKNLEAVPMYVSISSRQESSFSFLPSINLVYISIWIKAPRLRFLRELEFMTLLTISTKRFIFWILFSSTPLEQLAGKKWKYKQSLQCVESYWLLSFSLFSSYSSLLCWDEWFVVKALEWDANDGS